MHRPEWVDPSCYPFSPNEFRVEEGTIRYVDEGVGEPILMVHGTPTWSFLYRKLIAHLSDRYRVIAPDHLGFGLSDKPADAAYRPVDHARRLERLVDYLDLDGITIIVHDFGGPIGLSCAIEHPDWFERIVLTNTWLWSLNGDRSIRLLHRLMNGSLGRLFYCRFNGSARFLVKVGWGDGELAPAVHRHYTDPFPTPPTRIAPWTLARELIGSSTWYEALWEARASIMHKPTLVLWGLADPAFDEEYLERWTDVLADASVRRFPGTGHFVPDEASDQMNAELDEFLAIT